MDERETRMLMDDVATVMKSLVFNALAPVVSRLDVLEKRLSDMPTPKDGRDGRDADEEAVAARVAEKMAGELAEIRAAVEAIPPAPELPDVAGMIAEAVEQERAAASAQMQAWADTIRGEIKALPVPQDGKDGRDGKDADEEAIVARVSEKMAGEIAEIREALKAVPAPVELPDIPAMVKEAVAAIPAPKDGVDGKSVTDIDVSLTDEGRTVVFTFVLGEVEHSFEVPLVPGPKGEKGDPGEDGRDGVDVTDLFRAEDGRLIAVLGNGTTKDLGVYVGKDGEPGKDGRDGLGFDDMRLDVREEGTYLVWERGEVAKEAFLPVPFYRGVWSKDAGYRKGNTVTWGGSTWIATKDAPEGKPDTADSGWVLSTKRGRDGKDPEKPR